MKIILATSMRGLGGTETASLRLGALLARRGHDVLLAASDGPLVAQAQAAGIRWQPLDFYGGAAGYLKAGWAFAKLLRRERPHIVHCQMARIVPACALAAKAAALQTKTFYHARGLDAATYPKIARLFARLGVFLIANCRHERDKFVRHGFPAARAAYTYNALPPIPAAPQKTPRSHIALGTLSRLDKVRAVHLTLDAFALLLQRGLNARLHIAGKGEERAALEAQAAALGVGGRVSFLGAVRDLDAYFAATDILLNTPDLAGDHGAGVGNNILEAGLYETAVVSYDAAGIAEMVENGVTGYCTPLRDSTAFAAAVETLATDPALRRRFGSALRRRVTALCSDDEIYRTTLAAYHMADKT